MMMKQASQRLPHEQEDDTLSALLDGELSDEGVRLALQRLGNDPGLRHRFSEYCAIGDALRGQSSADKTADLTARVMAALEQEPTVLAPMRAPRDRRTTSLWLAAAAVSAITWGLWSSLPDESAAIPVAANDAAPAADVQAYLAAHQDFTQAVIAPAEMDFTQVSLAEVRP